MKTTPSCGCAKKINSNCLRRQSEVDSRQRKEEYAKDLRLEICVFKRFIEDTMQRSNRKRHCSKLWHSPTREVFPELDPTR